MHAASSSTSVIAGSSQAGTAGPQGRAHGIGSRSRFGKGRNILLDRLFGRLPSFRYPTNATEEVHSPEYQRQSRPQEAHIRPKSGESRHTEEVHSPEYQRQSRPQEAHIRPTSSLGNLVNQGMIVLDLEGYAAGAWYGT